MTDTNGPGYLLNPDEPGLTGRVSATDPSGGGNPAAIEGAKNEAGDPIDTGVYWVREGGRIHLCLKAAGEGAGDVFELDSATGRVKVTNF